jgi:hypothetical protein
MVDITLFPSPWLFSPSAPVPRHDVFAFGELTVSGAVVAVRDIHMVEPVLARDNGKTLVLVPRDNFEWMSEDSIINEAGYFHEVKVSIAMIFIHY